MYVPSKGVSRVRRSPSLQRRSPTCGAKPCLRVGERGLYVTHAVDRLVPAEMGVAEDVGARSAGRPARGEELPQLLAQGVRPLEVLQASEAAVTRREGGASFLALLFQSVRVWASGGGAVSRPHQLPHSAKTRKIHRHGRSSGHP